MSTNETAVSQRIQQAVIERLALLSPDQQKEALAFIEGLAEKKTPRPKLWEMMQECIKDVPPEDWDDVPTDGGLNHDHYLYGSPKRYHPDGTPIDYEKLG